MEFIKPGTYFDFMKYRAPVMTVLGLMALLSLISLFYPGPNYGIDFAGGTEAQAIAVLADGIALSGQAGFINIGSIPGLDTILRAQLVE